ncbi:MAG: methylenetetrahydrofolate--tRNA-(uracil(54)-C(5))-methyltransferase (FADH(2)-oxidizing) TrmFO [Deltaproteobacteria bacterium RBG_13_52_11]|nr:MAG: methylenetetrahydrofolate--tRNA-(uracil(54)-C(5))-methyltransferase (FADH(2)-oxidizing) TrmFO [Deltaproteobacteria bacterium RBG_13_52_11]
MRDKQLLIVGGGLAGCEAAWQASCRGIAVTLFEMKPKRFSGAHHSPLLGELVCSNSLKSEALDSAPGLLKEELRRLNSLIIRAAEESRVPAGSALAVDREVFSRLITEALEARDEVEIIREEITSIPQQGMVIIATGPLTSDALARAIMELTLSRSLAFYDAISPIVTEESINFDVAFKGSRYGKGGADYINCPMNREEYYRFVQAVQGGQKVPLHAFEEAMPFEGCLPIEDLAERGDDTLAFGPMKPVGLIDPRTGGQPFAVVQLRQENKEGALYNIVGFQTKLTYPEQERIFRLIPGLEQAEFARHGSLHRNTFIDAPRLLQGTLQFKKDPRIFFAGQITGVEGYMESTAMGLLAGVNAAHTLNGQEIILPPRTTAMGALVGHITNVYARDYQPMNINFGLFPPLGGTGRKGEKRRFMAERALRDLEAWKDSIGW